MADLRRVLLIAVILGLGSLPLSDPAAGVENQERPDLAAIAAVDTTPSNIWIAQALIGDILDEIAAALPESASRIVLQPLKVHEAVPLFQEAAAARFTALGHDLFLDETNVAKAGAKAATISDDVDLILRFSFESLNLRYPDSGRRFGLWRQWVDRELELSMFVGLVSASDGEMLMDRRLVRIYEDRVPADRFDDIASPAYAFTRAEVAPTGFRGVLENLVIVGSLAGLIGVYFANSGS